MIKTLTNTLRFMRELNRAELRTLAQDYADGVLGRYGYRRDTSTLVSVLSMTGAFGAGVAVGAGIGVLVAPRSGAETRAMMVREWDKTVDRIKERVGRSNGARHIVTDDEAIRHASRNNH